MNSKRGLIIFFQPCERGFTNELIIQLSTRRYIRSENTASIEIAKSTLPMNYFFFITQGLFALTNKIKINPSKPYRPFLILPRNTVYGDYQILFDLYPNCDFRTYVPDSKFPEEKANYENIGLPDEDIEPEGEYVLMQVESSILKNLCELYPETSDNLRYRSLDRR